MTTRTARATPVRGPRAWAETLSWLWRGSLRFRTTVITVAFSSVAVLAAFVFMSFAIQDNLFQSRVQQALRDSSTTTAQVQKVLDAATVGGSAAKMSDLMRTVQGQINLLAGTELTAGYRDPSAEPMLLAEPDWATGQFPDRITVSEQLRKQVREKPESSWWQSVGMQNPDGSITPAIVVGTRIVVPEAGVYELYLAYDLEAQQQTLGFVQGTLWLAGLLLLAIIGVISWLVLRFVTDPIAEAAHTSARLASGDLGVRIDVQGDDEIATLGRSFNAMADSIERQIADLGELSLVQQRFVSDVSHELRTPLTTIRLAADMLNDQRDAFDPVTSRSAELLHQQVQRFELLLQDLLEISRYDAGSVQLEVEPTSLAVLAEDLIEQMQPLAEQNGTDLRLVSPGGYSLVDLDPRRVRRIVRNLIGNAIEHGEGRPVVVTVDSDQNAVAIGVRDYGIGMRAEDTDRVFDRFWRADPSRKRTIGGTGLGLSISLGDAKLHNGTLAVWSEPGKGTNFVLTLPRHETLNPNASPVPLVPVEDAVAPFDQLGMTQPIRIEDDQKPEAP